MKTLEILGLNHAVKGKLYHIIMTGISWLSEPEQILIGDPVLVSRPISFL